MLVSITGNVNNICFLKVEELKYREIQKEVYRDNGLALFTISSRQDSTDNEIEIKVKIGAVLPGRECKQSEPGVTTNFFLIHPVFTYLVSYFSP